MTEQVNNFQNQAKKLPKALRDWQAFVDCKKVIDDFLEELPLFQQLASKAMRPRYVQSSPNLLMKYYCSMPHPVGCQSTGLSCAIETIHLLVTSTSSGHIG